MKNCKNMQGLNFLLGHAYRASHPAENSIIFRRVFPIPFNGIPDKKKTDRLQSEPSEV